MKRKRKKRKERRERKEREEVKKCDGSVQCEWEEKEDDGAREESRGCGVRSFTKTDVGGKKKEFSFFSLSLLRWKKEEARYQNTEGEKEEENSCHSHEFYKKKRFIPQV